MAYSLEESSKTHIGCKKPHKEKPAETTLTVWATLKQIKDRHRGCCSASLYKHHPGTSISLSPYHLPFNPHLSSQPSRAWPCMKTWYMHGMWYYSSKEQHSPASLTFPMVQEQMEIKSLLVSHELVPIPLMNLEKISISMTTPFTSSDDLGEINSIR